MAVGKQVEYERPPVRNTVLTVYFEPIVSFDVALAVRLQNDWGDTYPAMRQSIPSARWAGLPEVNPFSSGSFWTMSAVEQADESLNRVISYQFDQMSLSWAFDDDAADSRYPGFEKLSAELNQRFEQFVAAVNSDVVVQACECTYTNALEQVTGAEWVVGYLTNWENRPSDRSNPDRKFFGVNLRDELEDVEEAVRQVVFSRLRHEGDSKSAELEIKVIAMPTSDAPLTDSSADECALRLMEFAHAKLIETFESISNDHMKAAWGRNG